jgi:AcrR family transcriptional regulator
MTPPGARRLSAPERRKLIETAATRLLAERGIAATTVDDIAQAAGVTKPMLYRHFESKQDLCVALLEKCRADLIAAPMDEFAPDAADPVAQLPAMVDAWLGHIQEHRDAARLLFTTVSGDAEVERVQREIHARMRATHAALLREFIPGLDETDSEILGEVIRAGLAGIALWWLDHPEAPRDVPARAALRLARGIILTNERNER